MHHLFTRLLGRLSVSRKLMLIYLLDLSAVIYVSSILINEKYIAIDFARKEVQGNAYIAGVREGMLDAARLRTGVEPAPAALAVRDHGLRLAEQRHGDGLRSAEPGAAFREALQQVGAAGADGRAAAVGGALTRGNELVTRIGNQSNLILDPDLDSYYTMSLIVLRYPELLQLAHAVGAHLEAAATERGGSGSALRTQYLVLEGRLDAAAQAIGQDHAEAFAAGTPALAERLRPRLEGLQRAIDGFRGASRALIDQGAAPAALTHVRETQAVLIREVELAWTEGGQVLDGLLAARIEGLFQRMWLHLGTALVLLAAILGMVTIVARAIARPLARLAGVADTVRRTADYSLRASWHSGDEIGRLVVAFNEMLGRLDLERETQKELAASARAAEAQRALVESTPIALVVTSVPGHEVLHANPPAAAWLAGHRIDPWRAGLEPAVRSRFFQQLADRDAVDQFEVRWGLGSEPTWAVLSARRVVFEGRDAVLTAFTPINHLKVMERRLELWAKVFQASSEGIVIVDGVQQVLTINRAFMRATGFELQEVLGGRPGELFFDARQAAALEDLWLGVAQRGSWSGEIGVRRRDGSSYPAWVMASAVREPDGSTSHTIIISVDITDRKESEARIRYLAEHDVLTELPNRAQCTERLRLAVQQARRNGEQVAVMFIDLDRFKDINDSLGHHVGDGLLRSVARRLGEAVREGDTVSRLGGDEFVVVLGGVRGVEEVAHVVEQRLIPRIRAPHRVGELDLTVSCSVGIAIFPDDAEDLDALMRHADTAMYQAKAAGRDGAQFFTPEMTERAQQRLQLEADLKRAVEQQQFVLHWQPRVDAQRGGLRGVEGLLRWQHPTQGLVLPGQFITVAEETGLIVPIGRWVIQQACRQAERWRDEGLPSFGVSINLSALQLRESSLADDVADCLARHRIPSGQLELELTESMVMNDAEGHLRQMHALRALGVKLSIDDFGTGYSSLAYLNRLPIDKLKIDRGFVHDMLSDPTDRAITMAIIGLGHTLGLKVVAEGVEREAEAVVLREALCDELQGYLYARPMPAEALAAWIAARGDAGGATRSPMAEAEEG
ncbi:MAG TPA: EAL domain-containing protein [Methylibium sp.]|nr:EAL domain-containing protein [Methylibium sp.]